MSPLIIKAFAFATNKHHGQFRRDGMTPYIEHPLAVYNKALSLFGDKMYDSDKDVMLASALLHDVLEDTDTTPSELYASFGQEILDVVMLLTFKPSGKSDMLDYNIYLQKIAKHEIARRVKIADMLANLSDNPTPKQIKKYGIGLEILNYKQ